MAKVTKTAKKITPNLDAVLNTNEGTATPNVEVTPVQLTIADLQLLARIIDLASRRGAFQAPELSQVGDAYNKLSGFLSFVEATQAKEKEAAEAAAPTA